MKYTETIIPSQLGQELYYPICRGMVVPVYVEEIHQKVKLKNGDFAWRNISKDGDNMYFDGSEDWIFTKPEDIESVVYESIWIDEIVGYALEVGEHVFRTVEEALILVNPVSLRQAKRAHKKLQSVRKKMSDSINRSHVNAGLEPSCPLVVTNKRIYTKTSGFRGWSKRKNLEKKHMRKLLGRL